MQKDQSSDSFLSQNSMPMQLSFSRIGKTFEKNSFNTAKKIQLESQQSTVESIQKPKYLVKQAAANFFLVLPSKDQRPIDKIEEKRSSSQKIQMKEYDQKEGEGGNFIFKTIPRRIKQRSRNFEPEKSYDNRYLPKWMNTKRRSPSYSFRIAEYPPTIEEVEDEHKKIYQVCEKDPVLIWTQQKLNQSQLIGGTEDQNTSRLILPPINEKDRPIKKVYAMNYQQMNNIDAILEKQKVKRILHKIKFSRKTHRKPLITTSIHQSEAFLNNFKEFQLNSAQAHNFDSNDSHDLHGVQQTNQASYELLKVNYDRIYPRQGRGNVAFANFVPKIKLRSDRDGTPPVAKLEYNTERSRSYQMSNVSSVKFQDLSPRQSNIFLQNQNQISFGGGLDKKQFELLNYSLKTNGTIEVSQIIAHTHIKT